MRDSFIVNKFENDKFKIIRNEGYNWELKFDYEFEEWALNGITHFEILYRPYGNLLAACFEDGTLKLWKD